MVIRLLTTPVQHLLIVNSNINGFHKILFLLPGLITKGKQKIFYGLPAGGGPAQKNRFIIETV